MNEEQINLLKHIKKINKKNKFNAPASKHRSCHSNSTCNIWQLKTPNIVSLNTYSDDAANEVAYVVISIVV
jgi:hypothetical protein